MPHQAPFVQTFAGATINLRMYIYPQGSESPTGWGTVDAPGYERQFATEEEAVAWFRALWVQGREVAAMSISSQVRQLQGQQLHTADGTPFAVDRVTGGTVYLTLASGASVTVSGRALVEVASLGLSVPDLKPSRIKSALDRDVPGAAYIAAILRSITMADDA